MRVKILDKFGYQTYPIVDGMIEVDEKDLEQIGKTKCFDTSTNKIVDCVVEQEKTDTQTLYENKVVELIRQKYTINDEFKVHREKEENPEQYEAYKQYVQQCKVQAKIQYNI